MYKQKGQSMIEFALILPFFFTMCFGMIYGGIMFMDYLQFNNAARAVSRTISLAENSEQRETIAKDFEQNNSKYVNQLTTLYTANLKVSRPITNKVTIIIELTRNDEDFPGILTYYNFPPKKLKPIKMVMPLELKKETG